MSEPVPQPEAPPVIAPETPFDRAAVDRLIEDAFGSGRFSKTAERLREGNTPLHDLCFVARAEGRVIGGVRLWPVTIGGEPSAFLGPIAVDAAGRSRGVGALLVEQACEAARAAGYRSVLLVGDAPYFGRFGFERANVRLPGPVDPRRALIRTFEGDAPTGDVSRG
jgi:predicted N-acetyltransferase YhbS